MSAVELAGNSSQVSIKYRNKNVFKKLLETILLPVNLVCGRISLHWKGKGWGRNKSNVWILKYLFHGSELVVFQEFFK